MASAGDARRLAALFVETNLSMRPDEARQLYEGASLLRIGGADGFVRDALRGIIGVRRGETGAVERMQRALATHLTARPHPDVGLSMVAAWTALGLARPQDVRPTLGPNGISIGDDEATSAHLALLLGVSDCWLGDLPRGAHALRTCLGLATRPEQAVEAALAHLAGEVSGPAGRRRHGTVPSSPAVASSRHGAAPWRSATATSSARSTSRS